MIRQYPHYLFIMQGGDSVQDEHGDWIEVEATQQFHSMCREEVNSGGRELRTGDGLFYRYSSLIQLPKGTPAISEGTEVVITNDKDGNDVRLKSTVLRFESAQLHSRMWLK